jgi:Ca2+:H+ antiporter
MAWLEPAPHPRGSMPRSIMKACYRDELILIFPLLAGVLAFFSEDVVLGSGQPASLVAAAVLVGAIVMASVRVAKHAEHLAVRVGDPYGTMILTLSAVAVEVIILAILLLDSGSKTLVRDTIYAAVMLDINGLLGLAALLGGLRYGEQPHNNDSSRTYSVMILTAMGISMVVPEFIPMAKWHYYSAFTIVAMVTLYALFLRMQVGQHSYFFSYAYTSSDRKQAQPHEEEHEDEGVPIGFSIGVILLGVVMIGGLAEIMSTFLDHGLEGSGAPPALMAVLVAAISAAPEILTALRAALRNRMQAVVNIAMGASLSTVILTVPVMEAIALFNGQPLTMAMTPVQTVMVTITLIAAAINLNDGETNAIEGMTHFVLFGAFVMLTMLGL